MADSTAILHVDDDPSFGELAKTFLERENDRFAVETVTGADAGLERISDGQPDCIVSDYDMSGMDGLEFLQAVRETHPDLPFILFTGKGSEEVASDAIAAGVTDYIRKGGGSERYELLANRIENAVESRREAKRADRQEELMRLTEFAGDTGGFELDRETNTVLLTAGTRRIIGRPDQHEVPLKEALELFHPDDRTDIRQTLDRAFETGEELHDTWRLQPDGGGERFLDVTITPVVENGEVTKLRGAGHDITDRKDRQRDLEQIETLFEHAQDAEFLIGVAGGFTIEQVNPSWKEITGLSADHVRGKTPTELLGEQQGAEVEANYRKCVERREPLQYDEQLEINGEFMHWETTIAPVVINDTVEYIAGSTRDVTERKERERQLERINDLMSNMEQLADTGAWEHDPEADTLVSTDGVRRIHGFDPGADPSMNTVLETFHPDDRDLVVDRFDTCLETGEPYEVDVRITTLDGEQRWITTRGERVNDGESGVVVRGYTQDITEQKEREQKLKAQNERLEEFTSIVSHDLRNPLNVVGGRLELARETCESDHLDQAADALDRSQALIDDLLRLAREGETLGELEPVGLADMAESGWQTVETGSATLETHATQTIRTDRSRFQGLLENLYRNAVEHGGDDVTVSVGPIDDGFYVADTGPGIPESERADIFEGGYSTNDEGTGFGLRIVEQIADAHDWEITLTESERGGARFEFTGVERVD
ncbi:MAG: PAS domain S-box protein [Halobacteriales archaeon]